MTGEWRGRGGGRIPAVMLPPSSGTRANRPALTLARRGRGAFYEWMEAIIEVFELNENINRRVPDWLASERTGCSAGAGEPRIHRRPSAFSGNFEATPPSPPLPLARHAAPSTALPRPADRSDRWNFRFFRRPDVSFMRLLNFFYLFLYCYFFV